MADDARQGKLFAELPPPLGKRPLFKVHGRPLWTENKAKLIERYLYYFVLVTKHGAYIDGFAAPQNPDNPESWAAKLVLASQPQLLREFWLCDIDTKGVAALETMVATIPRPSNRRISVVSGDFNKKVGLILAQSGNFYWDDNVVEAPATARPSTPARIRTRPLCSPLLRKTMHKRSDAKSMSIVLCRTFKLCISI